MAYDEKLALRVRDILNSKGIAFEEKKMMGGLTFLVDGKMCVGVIDTRLMARIDPEIYNRCLTQNGCKVMDFTGRPMKGYVFVESHVTKIASELINWVQLCLDYNPKATSTKGKKRTKS